MIKKTSTLLLFSAVLITLTSCDRSVRHKTSEADDFQIERNNSLELVDFLEEFTQGMDWSTGARNRSIEWLRGIEIGKKNDVPEYTQSWYSKKGRVHITMDGEFSDFYFRKTDHPVPWSINMYGARTMYSSCALKSEITGGSPKIIETYLKDKGFLLDAQSYKMKPGLSSFGVPKFTKLKIKLPSERIVYILHEALYMNNVCDQVIYFRSDGSENIELPPNFDKFHVDETINDHNIYN